MARQILPLAGAVIGSIIAPGIGGQVGFAIGSLIGNAVDPIEMQGRKLGDAPSQVAAEGGARAIVFGTGCIRATVILERGGRDVVKQRDKSGKGSGPTTINDRAFWTYAIGLGEAIPGGAVLRIWENEKLVYDITPESQIVADSAKFAEQFRFYDGAEDQLPDPALEALHGTGNAPYYRGTTYMVFPRRDLTDFGEAVPTYRVEVVASATIDKAQMLAFGNFSGADYGSSLRLASDYSGDWVQHDELQGAFGNATVVNGKRVIAYGHGNVLPAVTDDVGLTFTKATGSVGVYSRARGWAVGDVVMLPNGLNGAARSMDAGQTFSLSAGTDRLSVITAIGSLWLGCSQWNENVERSGNNGATWDVSGSERAGSASCAYASDSLAMFGTDEFGDPAGVIYSTIDGVAFVKEMTPTVTGPIRCIHYHGGVWVAGTSDGEILYKNNTGWHLSAHNFGQACTGVTHNGTEWVMVGGYGSNGPSGYIKSSPDGESWTTRRTFSLSLSHQIIAIVTVFEHSVIDEEKIPLSSVISAVHERCGHASTDYDVTELSELITGVVVESTVTAAEAINSIIGCHFADPSDYDGQIHYVKRGKPVVKTLTADDLIDEPESAQRNNAIEYPRKAHFLAQRADLAYAASKSTSARYSADAKVVGEASYTSPETFSDPQAPAEIAVKLHKVLWTEAEGERVWHVTDEHLDLVPTDAVGLSYRGELVRCRITQIEDDPGQRKLKMIRDRQSAYTANLTEIPNPVPPTPPQSSIVAPTVLAVMDLPALTDNADTMNYYVGMSGQNDQWIGAVLQQSLDAGASFGNIGNTTINAIMGTTLAAVSDASPYYTDGTNTVEVTLYMDDELESVTPTAFLSNGGAFALSWQDSGETRWELMQYRDAEHVSGNTWRLSHLLRGRKNTEAAEHPPGAMFVLIDTSILRQSAQTAWLGTDLTHRAVSNGLSPETAVPQTGEYVGHSQREWPVASLTLSRPDASTVSASVVPRHRFGSSMNPVRSINWDGYRWTATDGTNTINRGGTAATETFDTTGWASPVSVTVAQLNRLTGPGDAVTEDIA